MGDVMKARKPILAAAIILTMANVAPADGDKMVTGTANRACEISFTSRKAYADPFNDVTVDAVVTAPASPAATASFNVGELIFGSLAVP
jgi:hypothetical protein